MGEKEPLSNIEELLGHPQAHGRTQIRASIRLKTAGNFPKLLIWSILKLEDFK